MRVAEWPPRAEGGTPSISAYENANLRSNYKSSNSFDVKSNWSSDIGNSNGLFKIVIINKYKNQSPVNRHIDFIRVCS